MLDRLQGARSAERKAGIAAGKGGGVLAGQHLGNLAGLEVGDLDLATDDVNRGAGSAHGDAELCALDYGGEVGRLDLEMLDVLRLDLEQDRASLLSDGGRKTVLLLRGQADH